MGAGDMNSLLHVCLASSLSTDTQLKSIKQFLNDKRGCRNKNFLLFSTISADSMNLNV